jgi:hypothetical protein
MLRTAGQSRMPFHGQDLQNTICAIENPRAYSRRRSGAENRPRESNKRERIREHVPVPKFHATSAGGVKRNEQESTWRMTRGNFLSPFQNRVSIRRPGCGRVSKDTILVHSKPRNVFAHSRPVPERWRTQSRIHPKGSSTSVTEKSKLFPTFLYLNRTYVHQLFNVSERLTSLHTSLDHVVSIWPWLSPIVQSVQPVCIKLR